jgi:hypothetical protein
VWPLVAEAQPESGGLLGDLQVGDGLGQRRVGVAAVIVAFLRWLTFSPVSSDVLQ